MLHKMDAKAYNLDSSKGSAMTFKVKTINGYFESRVAFPVCKKAKRLCKIINTNYLLPGQLKALELEGYNLKYQNEVA